MNYRAHRFENTSCSNCHREFGPGDHGFSHCWQHEELDMQKASVRPFSSYPRDRATLLGHATAISDNWEAESHSATEMAALVEAILTDEAVAPEVQELAALVDAAQKALNYIENTESELGIKLDSGDALRAVLAVRAND